MIHIKPNLAEAVAFAVSLPTDQAHLCAIHPAGNRPVVARASRRQIPDKPPRCDGAKKIKAGRVPVLADIVTDLRDLVVYALEEFAPAAVSNEMTTTRTESSGTAYETIGSPDIPETVDLSTLDESLRSIIENGPPADYTNSRSEAVYTRVMAGCVVFFT